MCILMKLSQYIISISYPLLLMGFVPIDIKQAAETSALWPTTDVGMSYGFYPSKMVDKPWKMVDNSIDIVGGKL